MRKQVGRIHGLCPYELAGLTRLYCGETGYTIAVGANRALIFCNAFTIRDRRLHETAQLSTVHLVAMGAGGNRNPDLGASAHARVGSRLDRFKSIGVPSISAFGIGRCGLQISTTPIQEGP